MPEMAVTTHINPKTQVVPKNLNLLYIQKNNWTVNSILPLNEIFVLLSFDI